MGELGAIRTYHYWSDRRIRAIATDNNIDLQHRWRFSAGAAIPGLQVGVSKDARELHRHEIATRIETAIGQEAVEDFVTPPPVKFAKGVGHVEFARQGPGNGSGMGAVMHVQIVSEFGQRVHVCLFGSPDNFSEYLQRADFASPPWRPSAWRSINMLIRSHGSQTGGDDDEALAVDALGIVLWRGMTDSEEGHDGQPRARGLTVGYSDEAEWMAQIYKDVEPSAGRWNDDLGADRILIGAPLWIRTPSAGPVKLYRGLPRQPPRGALLRRQRDVT